jgi:hypothetical protein
VYFSEINVGVEKVGNADEDEDSDNGVVVAVDDSAVVAVDGGAVVAVADSAISSSKTFQYSASVALAACFPGRDVGAGYFLHSSPISAKMSSDVEGVDEDDVDEDDEDEDVAFATVVDSFNPQYISSSSIAASPSLCLILLTNPAKDTNAAFRDSSDVVQIVKSRDAGSVAISAAKPCSARSNMFGLLMTSIANCEKQ